jgi:hypothetical protein
LLEQRSRTTSFLRVGKRMDIIRIAQASGQGVHLAFQPALKPCPDRSW